MEDNIQKPGRQRIGFFVTHSDPGGVQQIWANLYEAFSSEHTCSLVALYPFDYVDDQSSGLEFQYVVEKRPRGLWDTVKLFAKLAQMLRKNNFDLIFTAMPAANAILPIACWSSGKKCYVVTSHHTPAHTYNKWLLKLDKVIGRTPLVHQIVAVSAAVKSSFLVSSSESYTRKITVIHNALPEKIERDLANAAGNRKNRTRGATVISTGRLVSQKNYEVVVRTAARLPNVSFQIVGAGPQEAVLREMVQAQDLEGSVQFLGQRTRAQTLSLLSGADIFFQPSFFEGHSLALIEAAKLGLPLVVSNIPVQIEGISSPDGEICGFAAGCDDDEEFARIIQALVESDERYRAAEVRSAALGQEITFGKMLQKYRAIIATCLR